MGREFIGKGKKMIGCDWDRARTITGFLSSEKRRWGRFGKKLMWVIAWFEKKNR